MEIEESAEQTIIQCLPSPVAEYFRVDGSGIVAAEKQGFQLRTAVG